MVTTLNTTDSTLAAIEAALPIDPQPYTVGNTLQSNTLRDRPTGLIIVDIINGFCTVGSGVLAPTEPNEQIETMILESDRLAKAFIAQEMPVLAFLDTHEPGKPEPPYLPHCEKGSGEEKLVPQLEWLETHPQVTFIEKDCINGFIGSIDLKTGDNSLIQWINQNKLEALVVVGICTDICVMDFVITMLSARNHDMTPPLKDIVVYTKGCSTYNLTAEMATNLGLPKTAIHPQNIAHHIGLYTMAERGAFLADSILVKAKS